MMLFFLKEMYNFFVLEDVRSAFLLPHFYTSLFDSSRLYIFGMINCYSVHAAINVINSLIDQMRFTNIETV